jgi:hypothetical protein
MLAHDEDDAELLYELSLRVSKRRCAVVDGRRRETLTLRASSSRWLEPIGQPRE